MSVCGLGGVGVVSIIDCSFANTAVYVDYWVG